METSNGLFSRAETPATALMTNVVWLVSKLPSYRNARWLHVIIVGLLCSSSGRPAATKKSSAPERSSVSRARASHRSARKHAGARRSRARRSESQRRMAKLHLEPQRVQEIQRALNQAGYLHQDPSGSWDAETRAAMEKYQRDSGFGPTGLPDARSLMKLGLGPHPLPAAADPNLAKTTADSTPPSAVSGSSLEQSRP